MLQQSGSSWNFQTEAVLEQFVWDNLKSLLGLTPLKRQIYVAGQYSDIIAVSSDKQLVIIELKNQEDRYVVQQLTHYYHSVLEHKLYPDSIDYSKPVRLICDRSVTLERPYAIAKQFIVLEEGNLGLDRDGGVNNPDLGLIEVKFVPIKRRDAIALETLPKTQNAPASSQATDEAAKSTAGASPATPVGTGLSGTSSQDFVATNEWVEAPEIAPTYIKKYRQIGFRSSDPVTLHNMNKKRPPEISDSVPPRL